MKNKLFLKVVIVVFVLFVFNPNLNSRICANGAGGGYGENPGEKVAGVGSAIENYIIEGGGYFLKANSGISLFLNKVELSALNGVDYAELNAILNSAADNMQAACSTYENLIKLAEITPYDEAVTAALKTFNYNGFLKEKNLIPVIFNEVGEYLKRGDITGALKKIQEKFDEISTLLAAIRVEATAGNLPGTANLWVLNGKCCRALLFGQYIAEVFGEINK